MFREPNPFLASCLQEITLLRQEGEKLGMHIKGGLRGQRGNPLDKNDEGVFITKINSGGAAKRDGRLKVSTGLLFKHLLGANKRTNYVSNQMGTESRSLELASVKVR